MRPKVVLLVLVPGMDTAHLSLQGRGLRYSKAGCAGSVTVIDSSVARQSGFVRIGLRLPVARGCRYREMGFRELEYRECGEQNFCDCADYRWGAVLLL